MINADDGEMVIRQENQEKKKRERAETLMIGCVKYEKATSNNFH